MSTDQTMFSADSSAEMDLATGDEPMTGEQRSLLEALCAETGAHFETELSQAEAAELIGELKALSPRLQRP